MCCFLVHYHMADRFMNTDTPSPSKTYKLRTPGISDHAIYFTIVGRDEPEAFFINSKEMHSFQWVLALMTSYSLLLSEGTPVSKIIEIMKDVFDPNGKYIIPDGTNREAHSVVHHLGLVLEQHCQSKEENK